MKYKFKLYTHDMGSYWGVCSENSRETKEQNALWDVNRAREHDGLPPLERIPKNTTYTEIQD